jgi:NADH dehydrogenase/NADH:ubiquinone oxidoreductase subunit G
LSEIVNIIINNVSFQVEKGITILQAARKLGIKIPTLCDNEAIEPYGACRLCIVELEKGSRNRIVTSCLYPVEEGLIIKTDTERVIRNRKMLLSLLLTRCSENRVIKDLAAEYSIERPPFREKYW